MDMKDRIKKLRVERGLSQEELGNLVGLQKAAINKYESGLVVNPKRVLIERFAKALKTTPTYLMGWDDTEDSAADAFIGQKWDDDVLEAMEAMRDRPELQTMFSTSRHVKKEHIEAVNEMLKKFAQTNSDYYDED